MKILLSLENFVFKLYNFSSHFKRKQMYMVVENIFFLINLLLFKKTLKLQTNTNNNRKKVNFNLPI